MKTAWIIFPHQLFEHHPARQDQWPVYLVEEFLFFRQYHFHQQKIALHRASMKNFVAVLSSSHKVHYIEAHEAMADVRELLKELKAQGVDTIHYMDPTDNWLEHRIENSARQLKQTTRQHPSLLFLNDREGLKEWFRPRKRFFQTDFYIDQRKRRGILLDIKQSPAGGQWSFDSDNRKKYPAKKQPPPLPTVDEHTAYHEAREYVKKHFSHHYGQLDEHPYYPHTWKDARQWLKQFLEERLAEFGPYEDAMVAKEAVLHHSVLTPMLNTGLITVKEIIDETLHYAAEHAVPLNSLEGFIRQLIGWREFMRAVYELKGSQARTTNFWDFKRKIPASFWTGETGIAPIDIVIKKVLKSGYAHHIERLMVLGNFMVLCEFDPDDVYRWFMELFIDAYDWVMVPNVYSMSQFADGGIMATKPYISGSNYLMKMSDFPKGTWQEVWDGLFWRFMHVHRDFFEQQPRLSMLVKSLDKMHPDKLNQHLLAAENYLASLDHSVG